MNKLKKQIESFEKEVEKCKTQITKEQEGPFKCTGCFQFFGPFEAGGFCSVCIKGAKEDAIKKNQKIITGKIEIKVKELKEQLKDLENTLKRKREKLEKIRKDLETDGITEEDYDEDDQPELSMDCFAEILSFVNSTKIIFNILLLSKSIRENLCLENYHCCKGTEFVVSKNVDAQELIKDYKPYIVTLKVEHDGCGLQYLKYFSNLKKFDVMGQTYFHDDHFKFLTNVEKLSISFCENITGSNLKILTKLTELRLRICNKIQPSNLEDLTTLEVLEIKECTKIESPWFLQSMTNLKKLNLYYNTLLYQYKEIDDKVFNGLGNLESLELYNCSSITSKAFRNLNNLNKLKICNNNNIDDNIFDYIRNIETLGLIKLPKIKGKGLSKLEVLDLLECDDCENLDKDILKLLEMKDVTLL